MLRTAAGGFDPDDVDVRTGIEWLARAGYAAKGVVYGTIGVLAAMTAFGFSGGRIVGTESAIDVLRTQPFGQFIAWSVVVGLVGYVVWRAVQVILDPEHKGSDAKGLLKRGGLAISGLSYATLAFFTAAALLGSSGSSGRDGARESTARVMQYPWGVWLVGVIGVVFVGVGAYQLYRAWSLEFTSDWKPGEMDPGTRVWATRLSRFGIIARGISFGLIGGFLIQAAVRADPSEAEGLDGALASFSGGPLGTLWLALIGMGFVCYGIHCLVDARFRRINP